MDGWKIFVNKGKYFIKYKLQKHKSHSIKLLFEILSLVNYVNYYMSTKYGRKVSST